MKITEVSASYGRKKSDGDYGSRDVFFSLTAELGPDESAQEAQQELFNMCHEMVVNQYQAGNNIPSPVPTRPARTYKSDKQEIFMRGLNEVHGPIETPASLDAVFGPGTGPRGMREE